MLYMGIDVGTQGVRCTVVSACGEIAASQSVPFHTLNASTDGHSEQRAEDWRSALEGAVVSCTAQLREKDIPASRIRAISVDGTSGTILPLDGSNRPLCRGILYNDPRARAEAAEVHGVMARCEAKLGLKFGASFSLPRILWILRHRPDLYERTHTFAHQADYAAGLLCGEFSVSDHSNALKTGFDPIDGRWPEEIARLGIDLRKLPRVLRPGAPIAPVTRSAAQALGLSEKTMVVSGMTDGCASALAAGAVETGRWASIIGTTLVLKGVTDRLIPDPDGACYSHRLPSGQWLLGGAGNLGGRCLNLYAQGRSLAELDAEAESRIPTGVRCYPLTDRGERFPFVNPDFEPFYIGSLFEGRMYPALMEGVAFGERWALERMQALGAPVGSEICTAGGACRSDLWLRIRASVLRRRLKVPRVVDAAMGSALIAAASDFGSLKDAAEHMIQYEKIVDPDPALSDRYADIYAQFQHDLRQRLS